MIENPIHIGDCHCRKIPKHGSDYLPHFLALLLSQPCFWVALSKDCHHQSTALQRGGIGLHPSFFDGTLSKPVAGEGVSTGRFLLVSVSWSNTRSTSFLVSWFPTTVTWRTSTSRLLLGRALSKNCHTLYTATQRGGIGLHPSFFGGTLSNPVAGDGVSMGHFLLTSVSLSGP